jgi:hypothetical protein
VHHNLSKEEAKIKFYSPDGSTRTGWSKVTFMVPVPYQLGCKGQRCVSRGQCSSGKQIDGDWHTATCTTGYGIAQDNWGNHYKFTFGETAKEAVVIFALGFNAQL